MRVGIFGGSFDPPHVGHLLVAMDAREALGLDRLLVVPAATQPLKGGAATSAAHRLAMCRLTFDGLPGIAVDAVEVDRGGLSFMVDTVAALRGRWPAAELHLLVGEDVVPTLPRWREPDRLLAEVRLVVLHRAAVAPGGMEAMPPAPAGGAQRLATRRVDVSATEVRARVQAGRPIRGFVTDDVAAYITRHGLYLRESAVPVDPPRA